MAWTCSAVSNDCLVANLQREQLIKNPLVAAAMRLIDRRWFVVPRDVADAYHDTPLPIGYGATISAPHMHAIMLDIVVPYVCNAKESIHVLDIGSGSGYLTAVLAALCEEAAIKKGIPWRVVGLEHVEELKERSLEVIRKHHRKWVDENRVALVQGDGRDPAPALAPEDAQAESFDVIHVGAAATVVHPQLLRLLKRGGCLVIPVGEEGETQRLLVCSKDEEGTVTQRQNCLVSFVPLTSLQRQRSCR